MIGFVLANSVNPGEMLCYAAAFHLGLHCLKKYPFRGFQFTNGKGPTSQVHFGQFLFHKINYREFSALSTHLIPNTMSVFPIKKSKKKKEKQFFFFYFF